MIEVPQEEYEKMRQELSDALARVQHLEAQLDACSLAAQGVMYDLPKTAYPWSTQFDRVIKLRRGYDALCKIKI